MASRRNRTINMPAPYLRRIWLEPSRIADRAAYPFCLPFLQDDFELSLDRPITIIVGENGTGKSFKGAACELAAKDNPRMVFSGRELLFNRALSRRSRSRAAQRTSARLSLPFARRRFLRFFEERCQRQGIFIFDEPESALSPARQMEFLKLMRRMEASTICQIVMTTHSPMLMAYPNARLLRLTKYGLEPVTVEQTDHYKVMREFCDDPAGFVEAVIEE
jgi:predicted ATPase